MLCPGCRLVMQRLLVEGRLGTTVEVDFCPRCRAFWFDPFESVHLTPAATRELFTMIAEHSNSGAGRFPTESWCPKCGSRLHLAHDRQRNTAFQYWRCEHEHGRFTPFVDFLREKDFIRPLTPQQVTQLRENVQSVHCSNCAAPVDLAKGSICEHCGAPLSMLDIAKMREMAGGAAPAQPQQPIVRDPVDIAALLAARDYGRSPSFDLIDAGLQLVARWFTTL